MEGGNMNDLNLKYYSLEISTQKGESVEQLLYMMISKFWLNNTLMKLFSDNKPIKFNKQVTNSASHFLKDDTNSLHHYLYIGAKEKYKNNTTQMKIEKKYQDWSKYVENIMGKGKSQHKTQRDSINR